MNKKEIIQLVLVILGISVIVKTLINFVEQINLYARFPEKHSVDFISIAIIVVSYLILILIGYLILNKSKTISEKIIRDEDDHNLGISLNKNDIVHISIIILSLYFIVWLFPSFMSSIYIIIYEFIDDYQHFKEILPNQLWSIIIYITIIIVLFNSKQFSILLMKKIIK